MASGGFRDNGGAGHRAKPADRSNARGRNVVHTQTGSTRDTNRDGSGCAIGRAVALTANIGSYFIQQQGVDASGGSLLIAAGDSGHILSVPRKTARSNGGDR